MAPPLTWRIALVIMLASRVQNYESDANKFLYPRNPHGSNSNIAIHNGNTGLDSNTDVNLNIWEYVAWLAFTCLSSGSLAYIIWLFRQVLARICCQGIRGLRAVRIDVRLEMDAGITEISLCNIQRCQVPSVSMINEGANRGVESFDPPLLSPIPDSSNEQFHDCLEV